MFTYAYDDSLGIVVFLFSRPANTDADFERYITAIAEVDVRAAGRTDSAVITILDAENLLPPAKWRKRMSEATRALKTRTVSVIVTSSPLVHGMLTAMNWFRKSPFEEQGVVATTKDAIAWVEKRRGRRGLPLELLVQRVRMLADRGGS